MTRNVQIHEASARPKTAARYATLLSTHSWFFFPLQGELTFCFLGRTHDLGDSGEALVLPEKVRDVSHAAGIPSHCVRDDDQAVLAVTPRAVELRVVFESE